VVSIADWEVIKSDKFFICHGICTENPLSIILYNIPGFLAEKPNLLSVNHALGKLAQN